MVVGVMRRFDDVMQKPNLPDPLQYMSLSQLRHIRDLGIRAFNDHLSTGSPDLLQFLSSITVMLRTFSLGLILEMTACILTGKLLLVVFWKILSLIRPWTTILLDGGWPITLLKSSDVE